MGALGPNKDAKYIPAVVARMKMFAPYLASADFDTLYPGMSELYAEDSVAQHDSCKFNNLVPYLNAMAFHALHWLVVSGINPSSIDYVSGPMSGKRSSEESITFAQRALRPGAGVIEAALTTTEWGRRYLEILAKRASSHAGIY